MDQECKDRIIKGIAAYAHEQDVMLRLLRKRGQFTAGEFDTWLHGREWRRPLRWRGIDGDSFIVDMGRNGGTMWSHWLHILQYMMAIDLVDTRRDAEGKLVYVLPE